MKKFKIISMLSLLILGVIVSIGYTINTKDVSGNQSNFIVKPGLLVGTTTPTFYKYMTPGTGTTTLILDSYVAGTNNAIDSASLLIQLHATSTPPTLKWRYEYSQDGIDWYSKDITLNTNATTTTHVRDFAEQSWLYASSTGATATNSKGMKLVQVETPTRFIRVVFYLPAGSANATIFPQWVTKSQK